MKRNIGMLLLSIWLIATGILPFINVNVSGIGTAMSVLALAAGVFLAMGR